MRTTSDVLMNFLGKSKWSKKKVYKVIKMSKNELKKRKKENRKPKNNSDSDSDSLKDFELKKKKVKTEDFPNPDALLLPSNPAKKSKRRSHSMEYKLQIIEKAKETSNGSVARLENLDISMVRKWCKDEKKIRQMFENGLKFHCHTVSLEREMERKKAVKESMMIETSDLVATNLHWETNTENIIDYFRHLGELYYIQFETRLTRELFTGKCYIKFKSIDVQNLCLITRHMIDGKWIDVQKHCKVMCTMRTTSDLASDQTDPKTENSSYESRISIDVKKHFEVLKHALESIQERNPDDFWFDRCMKWSQKYASKGEKEVKKEEIKMPEIFAPNTKIPELKQMYRDRYR